MGSFVSDTDRTGKIIARIREQIKKAPPRKERFDLNAAEIDEVICILARSATNPSTASWSRCGSPTDCLSLRGIAFNCNKSC